MIICIWVVLGNLEIKKKYELHHIYSFKKFNIFIYNDYFFKKAFNMCLNEHLMIILINNKCIYQTNGGQIYVHIIHVVDSLDNKAYWQSA